MAKPKPFKPYPWGSYNLLGSNRPIKEQLLGFDWIKGHRIRIGWTDVQTDLASKEIVTTFLDAEIAKAKGAGQKIGLGVGAGVMSPEALWAIPGVTKFEIPPDEITMENLPPFMPLPWETPFQKYWFNVIKQLGKKYDPDPTISYVVFSGAMQGFENRFVTSAESEAVVQSLAKKAGFADFSEAWTAAAQAILQTYRQAFPTTNLVLSTTPQVIPSDPNLDNEFEAWAKEEAPGIFGTMTCALKAVRPPHPPNNNPPVEDWKWDQPIFSSADHTRYYGKNNPIPDPWPSPQECAQDMGEAGIAKNDFGVEFYGVESENPANAQVFRDLNVKFQAIASRAEGIRAKPTA